MKRGLWTVLVLWMSAEARGQELTPPRAITRPQMQILEPHAAREVRVTITLDARGRVVDAVVSEGAGEPFDGAALAAARRTRFEPARRDGVPVAARVVVVHSFASTLVSRPLAEDALDTALEVITLEEPEEEPEYGATVVVTGARRPETQRDATVQTEVISRQELEASGARDLGEALEERANLQTTRTFRGTSLSLRGLDPEYTLILVDGERIPGRIGGAIDLSRFGVENIERIEIVRGPSSALYGSDAIGGVVNVLTDGAREPLVASALLSGGGGGSGAILDGTARIDGRIRDGVRLRMDGGVHRAGSFGDGETTQGSARTQWSLGGGTVIQANRANRVRLDASYLRLRLQGVDSGAGGALFDRTQVQEQLQASLAHRFRRGRVTLDNRASYGQFREQYLLDQRGSAQLDDYEDNREHLATVGSMLAVRASRQHTTTVGFEQLFQSLDSARLARPGDRYRLAVFGEHRWEAWRRGETRLRIVPGVRVDLDSQFGSQPSPKIALRLDTPGDLVFRASYGRGFRAPSFQQLLLRFENPSVGYTVSGNPDLGAETSHGVDAGVQWTPSESFGLSAAFFRNDLRDMIAVVTLEDTSRGTMFSYANLARAWTMGLESSLVARAGRAFELQAGYMFVATRDVEAQRKLEGRARHRATLNATLTHPRLDLGVVARGALSVGRTYYEDADSDGVDEEVVGGPLLQLDVRAFKKFGRHFELFAGIENVTDAGDRFTTLRPRTYFGGARGRY